MARYILILCLLLALPALANNIVFIHTVGSDASVWDETIQPLHNSFVTWVWEMPGHGNSQPVGNLTIDTAVKNFEIYLAENEIDYPVIVGHGMGGLIAMQYSFENPAEVKSLILIDAAPKQMASKEQKIAVAEQLTTNYDKFVSGYFLNMSLYKEITDNIVDQALRTDQMSFTQLILSSFDFDITKELSRQAIPILLVGSHLLFPDQENAREQLPILGFGSARTISFKTMPNTGHFVMLEQPQYLASVISAFAIGH
jgi:pimeloyl-ACP methyl ester carboxylesterase